jgi:plasmid stability protein
MPDILIRGLSPEVRDALKERARRHGHSLSREIKQILTESLAREAAGAERLGTRMRAIFLDAGPIDINPAIEHLRRELPREPPDFE